MTIKQFSQMDPQWKSIPLGFDSTSTIGGYGCLLTSMNMCATHYGATNLTPPSLNDQMKANGGFQAGTAFLIAGAIGSIVPGMSMDYRSCGGSPAPLAEIDNHIAMNLPVIIEVDYSPSSGLQTHYMVAYAKSGTDYLVYDPYPFPTTNGQIKLSQSKYAQIAGSNDPSQIITGVFFTSIPNGPLTAPVAPSLDTGVHASFQVYAAADGLALRSQEVVADYTLLNRYAVNTAFTILEADAAANAKVGQNNLWLAVKAPDGVQGYVAAWLVAKTQNTTATAPGTPPAAIPVPANAPVVKTNVDALKLRSKPDSTDATILKVYPLGTELKCVEPLADVQRKVGVMYEWLNVSDIQSSQGVVAAWYVAMSGAAAFGPTAQPAQPPAQSAPASFGVEASGPIYLRTVENDLALRIAPISYVDNLVCRLPMGSELIALEPANLVAAQIGNTNQWIRVRDVKGNEGFVAAWLVEERPGDPNPSASPKDS